MRPHARAVLAGFVVLAALCLAGCKAVPQAASDQPISMTAIDGESHVSWCSEPATLTRIQVFFSPDDGDNAVLISDVSGKLPVARGQELTVKQVLNDWGYDIAERASDRPQVISITLYYESPSGAEGWFAVEMTGEDGTDVRESWPEGLWVWASGVVSKDRCGMPSAQF